MLDTHAQFQSPISKGVDVRAKTNFENSDNQRQNISPIPVYMNK